MIHLLKLLHIAGAVLALGGLLCQLIELKCYGNAADPRLKLRSERLAAAIISWAQIPGVYLTIVTGVALAWRLDWVPFSGVWLQFKLLIVFWIWLATGLLRRNTRNLLALRDQSGDEDARRLIALKGNHRMISYVTLCALVFVILFSMWKPL